MAVVQYCGMFTMSSGPKRDRNPSHSSQTMRPGFCQHRSVERHTFAALVPRGKKLRKVEGTGAGVHDIKRSLGVFWLVGVCLI